MRSVSDVKETHSIKALLKSFKHASRGILTSLVIGRNIKVHYTAAIAVVGGGLYFHVTKTEFLILLIAISQVITLEMINTAIENSIDLVTKDYHIHAKIAKDVAAGAVLIAASIAIIIGGIIFLPYILNQ